MPNDHNRLLTLAEQQNLHLATAFNNPDLASSRFPMKAKSPVSTTSPTTTKPPASMVAMLILASIAMSVCLILAMKTLMLTYKFKHIITLSSLHFLCTALFSRIAAYKGVFQPQRHVIPRREMLWMAMAGVGSIVFMNANLRVNSVGFYQMSKLCCIPYMIAYGRVVKRQRVSVEMTCALMMILSGVGMSTITDLQISPVGCVLALMAVVGTAQFQMWQGSKQQKYSLSALQITDAVMPWQFGICFLCAVVLDGTGLSTGGHSVLTGVEWSWPMVAQIGYTCLLAIAVNIVTYALIGKTSAVTFQVVGHLKTMLTLLGGYYLFTATQKKPVVDSRASDALHMIGVFVALVGMAMYGDIKNQASALTSRSFLSRVFPSPRWSKEF